MDTNEILDIVLIKLSERQENEQIHGNIIKNILNVTQEESIEILEQLEIDGFVTHYIEPIIKGSFISTNKKWWKLTFKGKHFITKGGYQAIQKKKKANQTFQTLVSICAIVIAFFSVLSFLINHIYPLFCCCY